MEINVDLLLILSVLFTYLIIGIYPSSHGLNCKAFLIANKELNSSQSSASIAASKIGGGLLVTYSSLYYLHGISALFFFVGAVAGYYTFYLLIKGEVQKFEEDNIYTLADLFSSKLGESTARTIGLLITFSMFGWIVTNLFVGVDIISLLTDINEVVVLLSIVTLITSYLLIGGFYSVVRTDFYQLFAIVIILALSAFALYSSNPVESKSLLIHEDIPFVKVVTFFVLGIFFPLGSAELFHRVIACKKPKTVKRALLYSGAVYFLVGIILTVLCALSFHLISSNSPHSAETYISLGIAELFSANNQMIYKSIWIIAFISILVSSADTFIFNTASSWTLNVKREERSNVAVKQIRKGILLSALLASILVTQLSTISNITVYFLGLTLIISMAFIAMKLTRFLQLDGHDKLFSTIIGLSFIIYTMLTSFFWETLDKKPLLALSGMVVLFLASISIMLVKRIIARLRQD